MSAMERGLRVLTSPAKREDGQSTVELALTLPVLIFVLLAIMEGGRIFSSYVELQNAAREGARFASLNCTTMFVRDDQVQGWAAAVLKPYLASRLTMLDPSRLSVSFNRTVVGSGEVVVEVSLGYPLVVDTPIISTITGNPMNLQSRMVMRSE